LNELLKLLLFLLVFDVLLDPGDLIFGFKEILFASIFFVWLFTVKLKISLNIFIIVASISTIIPLYGFIIGIIKQNNFVLEESIQYFKGFVFFLLLVVVVSSKIDISKYLIIPSFVIAIITILLYIDISKFSSDETYFFVEKNAAFISRRRFGDILMDPVIFYKTSPILIFPLSYYIEKCSKELSFINVLAFTTLVVALVISGTRANIISIIILVLIPLYSRIRYYLKENYIFILLIAVLTGIFILPQLLGQYVFNKSEESNTVKLGHLYSYYILFKNDIIGLFFGNGMGSGFYTIAKEELVYKTELTYLELLRMFGLIVTSFFLFLLYTPIYIFKKSKKSINYNKYKYLYKAYIMYLLLEIVSNPLLIGSTGMIIMVVVFSTSYYVNNKVLYE
jgi:hypothetical protein